MKNLIIPKSVQFALTELERAGFEAFIVGGCVRDILLIKTPKDWDITTNATPKKLLKVFPDGKYENSFGTVLVSNKYLTGKRLISEKIELSEEQGKNLIETAKKKYLNKIRCEAHGLLHAQKVAEKALIIAAEYKRVNKQLIELLAFFHDTGRLKPAKKGHIAVSQENIRQEMEVLGVNKKTTSLIEEALEHAANSPKLSLEAQILLEADLVEGVSHERINYLEGETKQEHFTWLKTQFNQQGVFNAIITAKGRELMQQAIKKFNLQHKDFKLPQIELKKHENIEITTYRIESKYSDKRHPDKVKFAKTLTEDLSRRDFTVNAMALRLVDRSKKESSERLRTSSYEIIDLFEGQKDLNKAIIRAVGDPLERFEEDALRMLRAVRFAVSLGFKIEKTTEQAILQKIDNTSFVSMERIRDEFEKIILSENPAEGIEILVKTGLMNHIIPEISTTFDVKQNRHHYHGPFNTVYKHLVASLAKCPSKKLEVRLAAFLHDIGKPEVKRGSGEQATFYNHEYVGERLVKKILRRLKFPKEVVEKTALLVKNHMFYYNVDEVGEAGVRRVVRKVGLDNVSDLIDVRIGDRLGSGVPKAVPYRLRHFKYMVEKVSKDPISVKQLKIDGKDLMQELKIKPGPQIGAILELLLVEVIERPEINEKKQLLNLAKNLKQQDLNTLRKAAKNKIKASNQAEDRKTKRKHWVK